MNWRRIEKEKSEQPRTGAYNDWKELIAKECYHRCVYCSIHESDFGGERNFHVEHFRPKSRFPALENNIVNLFYACAICNTFKSNDWPCAPCKKHSKPSYADPSITNYADIFQLIADGRIAGRFVGAIYMIEKLFLNRPQLIILRRKIFVMTTLQDFSAYAKELEKIKKPNQEFNKLYLKLNSLLVSALSDMLKLYTIRPYEEKDIKRTHGYKRA